MGLLAICFANSPTKRSLKDCRNTTACAIAIGIFNFSWISRREDASILLKIIIEQIASQALLCFIQWSKFCNAPFLFYLNIKLIKNGSNKPNDKSFTSVWCTSNSDIYKLCRIKAVWAICNLKIPQLFVLENYQTILKLKLLFSVRTSLSDVLDARQLGSLQEWHQRLVRTSTSSLLWIISMNWS